MLTKQSALQQQEIKSIIQTLESSLHRAYGSIYSSSNAHLTTLERSAEWGSIKHSKGNG